MDARAQAALERRQFSTDAVDEGALIDVHRIGGIVRRRLPLIGVISVVLLILAGVGYFLAEPRYEATARIALERGSEQVINVDQVVPSVAPDSASVDTEVQILQSPELAGEIVDQLRLTEDPEFNPQLADGRVALPPDQARRQAVSKLLSGLKIQREGFSYAITIRFTSDSPRTAARIANAIADTYVGNQVKTKADANRRASGFLETQLDKLRAQVQSAEAAVADYRANNQLFAASSNSSVAQQELSGLSTQLAEARAQQAAAEARLETARAQLARGGTGEELGEALDSPVVSQLRGQRAQLSRDVAALRARYRPGHPDLLRAEESLRDTDAQIGAEVNRIISNVTGQANAARQRTASLQGSLHQTEGTLAANNRASVRLNELERNAESARTLYQAFLDRYKQTLAQRGLERSNAYVVARATVPVIPVSPNKIVYLVLGLVAALGASVVAIAILQLLERGVETSEQVEKRLGIASVGSIPDAKTISLIRGLIKGGTGPADIILQSPQSAFAEAFRRLRTSIEYDRPDMPSRVVAITSALPGEGKTTTAICLARSAAVAGTKVVLVDCDIRRRASSRSFGAVNTAGLRNVLEGKAVLDEALMLDTESGAWILPQHPNDTAITSFTDKEAFASLIDQLHQRFELVVLDTPPILPVDEARVIAAHADSVILLMRWRQTPTKAAALALRELDEVGAHVIGISLNMVDMVAQERSGYGDVGYYYQSYKSYYA
ncbi:polysaccharide biosynthesis tyrosine autokinase [Sphingobium sp. BYY-5]|uniref:GumC family protein n=1 Tax=Sphingobium sp. BYY-5 TaxID=2926400 RepID=UPI001FA6D57A|nr:polysaccharide biosynthesis tyrosine autokinase [Sphingobium sp. BYY-5]MCI4592658.1 polysaccharide biosynthesis tyrosine autokinase [Sphingobium sp. BYY-5]